MGVAHGRIPAVRDMIARRFIVSGRVQGVGFRFWTRRMATQRDIVGWVRNRSDGTVEVQAEGSAEAVADLERLLSAGPPSSLVTAVSAGTSEPANAYGFSVLPTE